jgi:hypothetical protein
MAALSIVTVDRGGAALVANQVAAAGGGDYFANTGVEYVIITNDSGGSITVTEVIQATVDGQTITSRTVAIAAGITKLMGPYPTATYNDTNGRMNFTYSGVTSLTIGVFKNSTS